MGYLFAFVRFIVPLIPALYLASACAPSATNLGPVEYIKSILGGSVDLTSLPDGRTGQPIDSTDQLACTFDSICQWGSDGSHKYPWYKVTGKPDPILWQTQTGTNVLPDGEFALFVAKGGSEDENDWLMSDPISCAKFYAQISFDYWVAQTAAFKVCAVSRDRSKRFWCSQSISKNNQVELASPGPALLEIPQDIDEEFVFAFIPSGDGFVAIDNIQFEADEFQCLETTTEDASTDAPTEAPVTCEKIVCSFDGSNTCSWIGFDRAAGSTVGWGVHNQRIGNRDTGIRIWPRREDGSCSSCKYAGVNLNPQESGKARDKVVLESQNFDINGRRVLRFWYYEATADMQLQVFANSLGGSPVFESNKWVDISDRQWKQADVALDQNVNKLYFVAENFGRQIGSVAVDDIELLIPDNAGGGNACE